MTRTMEALTRSLSTGTNSERFAGITPLTATERTRERIARTITVVRIVVCLSVLLILASTPVWGASTPPKALISLPCSPGSNNEIILGPGVFALPPALCSNPVHLQGAGMGLTTLVPANGAAADLFTLANTRDFHFENVTIDMTSFPAMNTFNMVNLSRPIVENVEILYPLGSGSGAAFRGYAVAEPRLRNIIAKNPGACFDVNGDAGLEYFIDTFTCQNPGVVGVRILRTTATDVGGIYMTKVKITNPQRVFGVPGLILSSSVPDTALPTMLTDVVVDGTIGADSIVLQNVTTIHGIDIWSTNASPAGYGCDTPNGSGCYSALVLNNVTDVYLTGPYLGSASRDVSLLGNVVTLRMLFPKFTGPDLNIYVDTPVGKGNLRFLDSSNAGTLTNQPSVLAASSPAAPLSTGGGEVWTRCDQGQAQTLKLVDKSGPKSNGSISLRVGCDGSFQILGSNNQLLFGVTQTGQLFGRGQ